MCISALTVSCKVRNIHSLLNMKVDWKESQSCLFYSCIFLLSYLSHGYIDDELMKTQHVSYFENQCGVAEYKVNMTGASIFDFPSTVGR
jgi:hypothetical protein